MENMSRHINDIATSAKTFQKATAAIVEHLRESDKYRNRRETYNVCSRLTGLINGPEIGDVLSDLEDLI